MAELRIALCGASGTGKTTLSKFIATALKLPLNPVGSRSVASAMGFASPYDVDKAGKRAEFQRRLATEKIAWEAEHSSFVVDRTTLDNLAYTLIHDSSAVDQELLDQIVAGFARYTHVFFCPVSVFCAPGDDNARVKDMAYHQEYENVLLSLLSRYDDGMMPKSIVVKQNTIEGRQDWVKTILPIA